nr:MAG TPA: Protein of unknown function (DUF3761) [Caudoviricetes sp.]
MGKFLLSILVVFCISPVKSFKYIPIEYTPIVRRSGCCSHHGGVCGCYYGRAQCCDGALSPSCGC